MDGGCRGLLTNAPAMPVRASVCAQRIVMIAGHEVGA